MKEGERANNTSIFGICDLELVWNSLFFSGIRLRTFSSSMLFETRCALIGRWTSTPSHALADEERISLALVRVMELDRVYGFDMDLRAALVTNGEVIELDTLCKEASVRVGGVC